MGWVGEEDHLRIISMAPGGDVGRVFQLLIDGIEHMDSLMSFTSDERLGWLTFCPTNLGTAIRASVHIKLPLLARGGMEALQEVADQWQLQVRGSAGEHSEAEGGKYDISNRERMGLTEAEAVGKMWIGVKAMIQMEKDLEKEEEEKGHERDESDNGHHDHEDHDHHHSGHHKHKKHHKHHGHHEEEENKDSDQEKDD